MFTIKIAGVIIGIENKYRYVKRLCADYREKNGKPDFSVGVSAGEILREQGNGSMRCSKPYAESLCLFRKICNCLIEYDAFLMHSAVIAVDQEAYVFAAGSGTGKTTHIKQWMKVFGKQAQVVNGDKPIYRFIAGTLYACGTPWCGKEGLGNNIMCPVRAICFLEQGRENKIRPMDTEEVLGLIFHQLLMPREEEELNHFLSLVERMLTVVSCYHLQCRIEPEAALLAYETMKRNT